MIRFLADENFNGAVLRGLKRRIPDIDIIRVQDTEYYRAADPDVLAFAASEMRILLTHDINTINKSAYARLSAGLAMPGVFQVPAEMSPGQAIEDLVLIVLASEAHEWGAKVTHLPLK
ncbi:MAG: DUF5615 family PIN-like protein [Chloroflexi bacterium]|nr:DUF5615 family PIN-like protein [Chloroflexota bacterium]